MIDTDLVRSLPIQQQPEWPDQELLGRARHFLEKSDPLVEFDDCRTLTTRLGKAALGEAFMLQAGSCAESFSDNRASTERLVQTISAMSIVLMHAAGVPVVKVGRIAGQFAKPRSNNQETVDGQTLPVFRGEIVNSPEFTLEARTPDPMRMVAAYQHSLKTLHSLGPLTKGPAARLENFHQWNIEFTGTTVGKQKYTKLVDDITQTLKFMRAMGMNDDNMSAFHETEIYSSHEAVLIDYELALTRPTPDDKSYDSSAHMVWIGERTRDIDQAHVEFCANIENPIAVKLGPTATPEEVISLCQKLNPDNIPGRLTFVTRLGKDRVSDVLPALIDAASSVNCPIVWVCDPMHGNTITDKSGRKTRLFDSVVEEVVSFFGVFRQKNLTPGGIHLELTGDPVTECLGGSEPKGINDLEHNYTTTCDPRLNADQSIELAFIVAEQLAMK